MTDKQLARIHFELWFSENYNIKDVTTFEKYYAQSAYTAGYLKAKSFDHTKKSKRRGNGR
jgi:hypothetical protein